MGKRGPAPKPTNLRVLHGEKPYRINQAEPKPRSSLLTARSIFPTKPKKYGTAWLRIFAARGYSPPGTRTRLPFTAKP
jgi:hypothetical protein